MMESYLTEDDIEALQSSDLHQRTPFVIQSASSGYFSIARYYGGMDYNGDSYLYMPQTDELIRSDVVKWKQRSAKKAATPKKQPVKKQPTTERQPSMFDD